LRFVVRRYMPTLLACTTLSCQLEKAMACAYMYSGFGARATS
jgi:hypothetical protein